MFPRLIALGGVARAGKDTFFQTLNRIRPGGIRISIGDIIRHDCKTFIKKTTGINVNKCTDEEKEIIRPILVGYGITKRKQTSGAYFREKLEELMAVHSSDKSFDPLVNYFIMTDLRFAEYAFDEPEWVKANKGLVIHIARIMEWETTWEDDIGKIYHYDKPLPVFLKAPNLTELENDPAIRGKADYLVEWENKNDTALFEAHVNKFLTWFELFSSQTKIFRERFN